LFGRAEKGRRKGKKRKELIEKCFHYNFKKQYIGKKKKHTHTHEFKIVNNDYTSTYPHDSPA
jgi:hypothetical protein